MSIEIEGRTRWLRCLSTPNRHSDGSTTYNGYWLDITEQKEQVTRSQAVFRSAPNAYLFFDAEMGIQRANPAALRIFDAPSEQALLLAEEHAGEIDLIESPVPDLFPMLKADKNITLFGWNALGSPEFEQMIFDTLREFGVSVPRGVPAFCRLQLVDRS